MEAWGNRVYGCVTCQEICPFNRGQYNRRSDGDAPVTEKGVLGPFVSLEQFLALSSEELSRKLKNTALDRNWIDVEAIKRNCLIAAAHRKAGRLIPLIREYTGHTSPVLRETARWTLRKLGPD
jgi:epoxyqueuosine reductase